MQTIKEKIKTITDIEDKRAILGLLDIIDGEFGFNFIVSNAGKVIEVQMVAAGLVSIPRGLTRLKDLYRLHLQSNTIRRLRHLDKCESIQILDLSDNQIPTQELKIFENIEGLVSLNLSLNRIDNFEYLGKLTYLESLNLSGNYIEKIPRLPALNRLKFLDLSDNQIDVLENLHVLEGLIQLKMEKNKVSGEEERVIAQDINTIKDYCRTKKAEDQ